MERLHISVRDNFKAKLSKWSYSLLRIPELWRPKVRPLTVNSIICPLFEILETFLDVSKKTGKKYGGGAGGTMEQNLIHIEEDMIKNA